ncbi:MAG: Txe/YoeB family addiction module toxin [Cyanobacteria bacterium J06639_1]
MGKKKRERSLEPEPIRIVPSFDRQFREDMGWWYRYDKKVADRVWELVEATMREPFSDIGKPEPLKYLAANTWSRRITQEHRVIYQLDRDRIIFIQARYHY